MSSSVIAEELSVPFKLDYIQLRLRCAHISCLRVIIHRAAPLLTGDGGGWGACHEPASLDERPGRRGRYLLKHVHDKADDFGCQHIFGIDSLTARSDAALMSRASMTLKMISTFY
jgi:hypothetical protein